MVKSPELGESVIARLQMSDPPWREQFLGGSPARERALFADFQRQIRALQESVQRNERPGRPLRAFHAKLLLGVEASLHIDPGLAPELRTEHGFLQPNRRYRVSVRFSASSHELKADRKRDGRGIALRIHSDAQDASDGQEGRSFYDLLFSDSPRSHARNAAQFMTFVKVLSTPTWRAPVPLLRELGLCESVRLVRGLLAQTSVQKCSLATTRFWSKTPSAIHSTAVKYQLVPVAGDEPPLPSQRQDFLRADLIRRMTQGDVSYDLCVQRYLDEQRTPLEDHSQEWQERDARLERVGRLVIARGAFADQPAELEAAIEALQFNPWNTSAELRPLGSLNRARKLVYAASADQRARPPSQGGVDGALAGLERRVLAVATPLFAGLNRIVPWHRLPPVLGMLNLIAMRHHMREHNLHDTEDMVQPLREPARCPVAHRSDSGAGNDPQFPEMGAAGRRFGRNVPPEQGLPEEGRHLLTPSPREISRKLLARDQRPFVPATSLNLLAAGWIQFQTHDWFAHSEQRDGRVPMEIALAGDDPWSGPRPLTVPRTPLADKSSFEQAERLPPAHANQASHWWDGSQVYGGDPERTRALRVPDSASLALTDAGLLPLGAGGLPETGMNLNWWLGLELMHTLFAREHNQLCALLRRAYPSWHEDVIFAKARLINVALMAKIHTIEWTPAILAHPALELAMDAHWWGLFGKELTPFFAKRSRSELLRGIPGSRRDHFEVPFALTEEFVSVYRLHPLLPDQLLLRSPGSRTTNSLPLPSAAFAGSRKLLERHGLSDLIYSFGVAHPGAMRLHNYPNFLIELTSPGEPLRDVGALDILRDRERGVPRYNRFRTLLGLPRCESFAAITGGDMTLAGELEGLYQGRVDDVDLLVGALAEPPPQGFGFGDTAFRVFVLMASRRLKSDRFFTDHYNEDTYTPEGLAWVRDNGMRQVLLRNFPELQPALQGVKNPFAPWRLLDG